MAVCLRPLLVLLLALGACAEGTAEAHEGRVEGGACYAALESTARAWATVAGDIPPKCMDKLATYEVTLVPQTGMPCKLDGLGVSANSHQKVIGCTELDGRGGGAIYLLDGMDEALTVDTVVHEWVHALSGCVRHDVDHDHQARELWDESWDGVVGLGRVGSALGPCL